MQRFRLVSHYQPTGDQPRAIAQLVEGLAQGEREQTLLGVTGSGKSVIGESPVLVRYSGATEMTTIGTCIDELMERHQADIEYIGDSEVLNLMANEALETMSFDPQTGRAAWRTVRQLSRHWTPQTMTIATTCGRTVTATMDHNFYTMRGGRLQCVAGDALREGDYVPLPRMAQADDEELTAVDITPILLASRHEYYAKVTLSDEQKAQLEAAGVSRQKIWRIVHKGERLRLSDAVRAGLATDDMMVVGYNGKAALPLRLPVTDDLLRLVGYYIAEGCHTDGYVMISTGSVEVAQALEAAANSLGLSARLRPDSYDYQVTHAGLSDVLLAWCGRLSAGKHVPGWWPQLSRRQLGVLLGAYFDGDGSVEQRALTMTTVSDRLASGLQYIGDWLGISLRRHARTVKYGAERRTAYVVSASGAERLKLAAILELQVAHKRRAAEQVRNTAAPLNTNVDIVPLYGADFLALRRRYQLSQQSIADMAGVNRSLISMIEKGVRRPSRDMMSRLLRAMDGQGYEVSAWRYLTELRWGKIASIAVEEQQRRVYDFSVAGNETFLTGSGGIFVHNTFTMANIIAQRNVPTLVLAHNKTLAAQLFAEFKEFFPDNEVHYFVSYFDYYQPEAYIASSDTYIEKDSKINDEIDRLRHAATSALLTRRDVIIVASVSCIYGIGSPDTYADMALKVTRGERRVQDKFVRLLTDIQYKRNDIDFARGTFRVRGDVVDIYPAGQDQAVRVEFFGDEVDRITKIDALTGEILDEPESVTIFPSSHYATPRERIERAVVGIEKEFAERLAWFEAHDKHLEAQRLTQRTKYDLEMLRETGFVKGIENYSRYLTDREPGEQPATLIDYFPDDWLLLVDESHMTLPQVRGMYNGDRARKEVLVEHGFRLPSALDNRPLRFDEFERHINQAIYVSATPGDYEIAHSPKPAEQLIRPTGLLDPPIEVRPTDGQVDDLMEEIRQTIAKGHRVLVTTLTKRMAEDLSTYLSDNGVKTAYLHSEIDTLERGDILRELRLGTYDVLVGINLLREGLDLPEVSLVAIMDADKEGFLRSESALIQTIGRAARHVEGRVLMYGDTVTDSMRRAIDETNRRRAVQQAYNDKHNITPQTIQKKIDDGLRAIIPQKESDKKPKLDLKKIPKDEYGALIKELTGQMELHSANLEFEKAAELRDLIAEIRQTMYTRGS